MSKLVEVIINSKNQLIPLNGELINFELSFKVTTPDHQPFFALVLPKKEIDSYASLEKIELKEAPGFIKGNIKNNDNNYEDYFLLLRKEGEPITSQVEIDIKEIEGVQEEENKEDEDDCQRNSNQVKSNSSNILKIINDNFLLIICSLLGFLFLYYCYSQRQQKTVSEINVTPNPIYSSSPNLPSPNLNSANLTSPNLTSPNLLSPNLTPPPNLTDMKGLELLKSIKTSMK